MLNSYRVSFVDGKTFGEKIGASNDDHIPEPPTTPTPAAARPAAGDGVVTVIATARLGLLGGTALVDPAGIVAEPRFYAAVSTLNWRVTLGLDDEDHMVDLCQFPFRDGRIAKLLRSLDSLTDEEVLRLACEIHWIVRSLYNQRRILGRAAMGWCEAILPGVGQLLRELDRRALIASEALLMNPAASLFTAEHSEIVYRTAVRDAGPSMMLIETALEGARTGRRSLSEVFADLERANKALVAWREAAQAGRRITGVDCARYRSFHGPVQVGAVSFGGLTPVDRALFKRIQKNLTIMRRRSLIPALFDRSLQEGALRTQIEALNTAALIAVGELSIIEAMASEGNPACLPLQAGERRPSNDV